MTRWLRPVALAGLLVLSLLPFAALAAPPKRPKPVTRAGRATQTLDGTWKFETNPGKQGEADGWTRAIPKEAKETTVPALWGASAAPGYAGIAWYWLEFTPPATWAKQTVRLRFEAVADEATVWLNGDKLGAHAIGTTPFEFNITQKARIGQKNLLAVRAQGDGKVGAGIWQSVLLLAHDEAYLSDCFPQGNALGYLNTAITLTNTSNISGDATLDARVVAVEAPNQDVLRTHQNLNLTPGRNITTLLLTIRGKQLHLWSPETPFLYRLQLAFRQDMDVLDTLETTFGFREIVVQNDALTVNRQPITPIAVTLPDDAPLVLATPADQARLRTLLHTFKSKAFSILYLTAPPPILLRFADEEGLLVVEGPTRQDAANQLRELILRDRAHPCLIAWDMRGIALANAQTLRPLDTTRYWLVGAATAPRLWPPNATGTDSLEPPHGFVPLER